MTSAAPGYEFIPENVLGLREAKDVTRWPFRVKIRVTVSERKTKTPRPGDLGGSGAPVGIRTPNLLIRSREGIFPLRPSSAFPQVSFLRVVRVKASHPAPSSQSVRQV